MKNELDVLWHRQLAILAIITAIGIETLHPGAIIALWFFLFGALVWAVSSIAHLVQSIRKSLDK